MSGVRIGLALARERLRGPGAPLSVLLGSGALFASGVLERRADAQTAVDDTLSGPVFGIAVPLVAYLLSERLCAGGRLDGSVDGVARYGTSRRAAVLGLLLGSAAVTALISTLLCAVGMFGAHAIHDPRLGNDLGESLGIGLLAGVAYAWWFGAASLLGPRGGGRKWALIVDFVLGAGSSALALPWPRAHVRNLLGGRPALDGSQAHAWTVLALLALSYAAFSVARTRD